MNFDFNFAIWAIVTIVAIVFSNKTQKNNRLAAIKAVIRR